MPVLASSPHIGRPAHGAARRPRVPGAEATQLVARLAALVPRPRQNLVRYHGVLAAHAEDRAAIVPGLSRHDRGATVALSSPPPE